jgi:(5-formylfuran-3-yl)methyl phosphate synthase
MEQQSRRVRFLASVMNAHEARLCVALGADIIDAKDAAAGALGALAHVDVRAIRAVVPASVKVSATIGDPSDDPDTVVRDAQLMAATGVDYVKVGLAGAAASRVTLDRLRASMPAGVRLVGVLLADRGLDLGLVSDAQTAGFTGVMLDTADKRNGALSDLVGTGMLRTFVEAAHRVGLFAGFAGSLRASHVAGLAALGADVLGFRGGLCREHERAGIIDEDAVRAVRCAIDAVRLDHRQSEHAA